MPSPSQTEKIQLLRDEVTLLKALVEAMQEEIDRTNASRFPERIAVAEEKLGQLNKLLDELKQLPVVEDRVVKLEKQREEAEKRSWQFVFIAAGAACAIVGGVIVQLVSALLKK